MVSNLNQQKRIKYKVNLQCVTNLSQFERTLKEKITDAIISSNCFFMFVKFVLARGTFSNNTRMLSQ